MKRILFLLFFVGSLYAQRITTLDIDTARAVPSAPVTLLQGDTPQILINLTNGSSPYDLTGLTCQLVATKGEFGFIEEGTISEPLTGVISIPFNKDNLATIGSFWCDITLQNGGGTTIETVYLGSLRVRSRPGVTTPTESGESALYVYDTDSVLPDQATHSGEYLTTDGATLSWDAVAGAAAWGSITGVLANQTDLAIAQGVQDTAIGLNTTHRGSTGAEHSYLDQDVTVGSTPDLAGISPLITIDKVSGEIVFTGVASQTDPYLTVEDNSNVSKFNINSDGKVGIGLTNQTANLQVKGGASDTLFQVTNSANFNAFKIENNNLQAQFYTGDVQNHPSITFIGDTDTGFWRSATNQITAMTADVDALVIDANQKVTFTNVANLTGMTTAERDALTPVAGDLIYNSTINKHQGYNGTAWVDLY